ncbi:hypothetical protein Q7A53_09315 [Halobacillus rhizosphaerae]|uniref:hypothetical protein n=1 Tax=Halobacillus rhizosphaerae TaxID=3064889 RepID=UPI00398B5FCA
MRKDQALLSQISLKNKYALEQLYDRFHLILMKVIHTSIQDPMLSEQILKQLFKEIWDNPAHFDQRIVSSAMIRRCKEIVKESKRFQKLVN